ncbi:MAG: hypothetical protein ACYSX0_00715 [Planctomycetota bacterium]
MRRTVSIRRGRLAGVLVTVLLLAGGMLVAHQGRSPKELLAALRSAVAEFTGDNPQDDDRTAIVIKRS